MIFSHRLFLFFSRLRYGFRIEKIKGNKKIVVHEKYRNLIRIVRHGVTILGLISSFIAFSSIWISFIFAIILEILGRVFDKIYFAYSNMYIHPLPEFELKPDKWIGMGFGYIYDPKQLKPDIPVISMVFSDEEYGRNVFEYVKTLNYGRLDDEEKNILANVVVMGPDRYVFYLYPNLMRRTAKEFFKKAAKSKRKQQSVQNRLFTFFWFGKHFKIDIISYFQTFRKRFRNETPTLFRFHILDSDGSNQQIKRTDSIYLHSLKIIDRSQIQKKDPEYSFVKLLE
jgi:hypothetical protein